MPGVVLMHLQIIIITNAFLHFKKLLIFPNNTINWFKLNFQVVPLTAAVIVTTPQKLAFIDVAKGVRMFSKLKVCFLSPIA